MSSQMIWEPEFNSSSMIPGGRYHGMRALATPSAVSPATCLIHRAVSTTMAADTMTQNLADSSPQIRLSASQMTHRTITVTAMSSITQSTTSTLMGTFIRLKRKRRRADSGGDLEGSLPDFLVEELPGHWKLLQSSQVRSEGPRLEPLIPPQTGATLQSMSLEAPSLEALQEVSLGQYLER